MKLNFATTGVIKLLTDADVPLCDHVVQNINGLGLMNIDIEQAVNRDDFNCVVFQEGGMQYQYDYRDITSPVVADAAALLVHFETAIAALY